MPKEAKRCGLPTSIRVFSKIFCCTWAVGCQKLLHYLRMLCTGCFILNGIVSNWLGLYLLTEKPWHHLNDPLNFYRFIENGATNICQIVWPWNGREKKDTILFWHDAVNLLSIFKVNSLILNRSFSIDTGLDFGINKHEPSFPKTGQSQASFC